jgi:hypothetical protein
MNIKDVFIPQYSASLAMLKNAVAACDNALWNDTSHKNRFWHMAYHALFYTDLYLSSDEQHFTPWTKHRADYQVLGDKLPWPPHHAPKIGEPYTQAEILEYCDVLQSSLSERMAALDFEAASGFFWLPFSKFELHIYNIRHLQHHTGQLIDRLRELKQISIGWIGSRSQEQAA